MMKDRYGNPASTRSRAAMDHYNAALDLIRVYRGDPIAALDAALAEDPEFGGAWAARAGLLVQQTDAAYAGEIAKSLRAGAAANLNDSDRVHMKATQDWAEGRFNDGTAGFARIAQENPRDVLALQYAHVGCFYLGLQQELRDLPLQALRAFSRGDDGYSHIKGMAAFGLEECGDFGGADDYGREAVTIDPRDGWAVHAVAHVNEMRGDTNTGIPWLADNAHAWAPESGFACHNWWHLALLHMDRGDTETVLQLFDQQVRPNPDSQAILECIDASALLWRLRLEGVDVGDRFTRLADCWQRASEDAIYAFNDLHAIIAFLGAGRGADAERTLMVMRRAAAGAGDNAEITRRVGIPLAEAFIAFDAGRHAEAVDGIAATRGIAQRFGGSHAQRDILTLTALHVALRSGMAMSAQAFATERLTHKPYSPWAGRLARQARELALKQAA